MTNSPRSPATSASQLTQRVEELAASLSAVNPVFLSDRIGATFVPEEKTSGIFHLTYWGREITVSYPEFSCIDSESGDELGLMDQAMLAYYFATSDGTPLTGRWISFSELPDGTFYTQAFQGYTGGELAKVLQNDVEGFSEAAATIVGCIKLSESPPGDRAMAFQILPCVRLLVTCWLGDEDFPTSFRVLFDAAAGHHLTTDAYAIMGSMLTRRLIKAYGERVSGDRGLGIGD
jgi:hypothetical protein